jgi:hypothetical protein
LDCLVHCVWGKFEERLLDNKGEDVGTLRLGVWVAFSSGTNAVEIWDAFCRLGGEES